MLPVTLDDKCVFKLHTKLIMQSCLNRISTMNIALNATLTVANPYPLIKRNGAGLRLCKRAAGCALFALLALGAQAQTAPGETATTGIDATGNSQSELAACNNGTSQQSRQTCMTEVESARAAKRAGQLGNSGNEFDANALQRCDVLQGEDKIACQARVSGLGTSSGSVAGGGTIRQIESVVAPQDTPDFKVEPKTSSDIIIVVPAPK